MTPDMTPDDGHDDAPYDGPHDAPDDGPADASGSGEILPAPMAPARPPSPAAAASNWRTVVVADVGMGVAVVVVGIVLAFVWQPVIGGGIASLGLVYVVLAVRRAGQWADWRRRNGLS